MLRDLKDIRKYSDDNEPATLSWGGLFCYLKDINGNCSINNEQVKIKVIDNHNRIQFTNSKVYMTDNRLKGNERDISLVIRIEDNN